MKKVGKIIGLLVLVMFVFSGCSKENVDTSKINIVTSFYPMYIATANIVDSVEDVKLKNLTATTTGCLHDYQLSTANMVTLSTADILIINGGGMETFIDKVLQTYGNLQVINASESLIEKHEEEEENGEHHHGENAHLWVSISMYMQQVENVKNELIKLNPENAEKYRENANFYIQKLENLKEEMHKTLDGVENKKIVTFHEAFDFFAEEFDLDVVAVIEREPGTYPSAGELAKMIDLIREKKPKAIFVEPQYSRSAADTIAKETKIPVYQLDPVVTGDLDKESYIAIMEKNLEALKEAFQ